MDLIIFIWLLLPIALLVTFFIGIVKKNKRLWITSLIFFILITLAEVGYFTISSVKTNSPVSSEKNVQ